MFKWKATFVSNKLRGFLSDRYMQLLCGGEKISTKMGMKDFTLILQSDLLKDPAIKTLSVTQFIFLFE
jgi:hypothetical protein